MTMTEERLRPHPSIFNDQSQSALAGLLTLTPGWYLRMDVAEAMATTAGISASWAEKLLDYGAQVGATPKETRDLPALLHLPRVRQHLTRVFVYIVPSRIRAVWSDFNWSAVNVSVLQVEPFLPALP